MATPGPNKVLRVGVFQGERCIEERLIRRHESVTIGQTLSNTLVVPASSMPKSYTLFELRGNKYVLHLEEKMGGRLSLGGSNVVDLARLRNVKEATKTANGYEIPMTQNGRGKVTFGDTRVLFQFVTPPPSSAAVLPSALGGGTVAGISTFLSAALLTALALSALVQITPLFILTLVDIPMDPENDYSVPDWFLDEEAELSADIEEKKKDKKNEEEEGDAESDIEIPIEEPVELEIEAEPEPKKDPTDAPPPSKTDPADQSTEAKSMRKSEGKSLAIAALASADGDPGAGIVADIAGEGSSIAALDGLKADDFGGTGGGTAKLGLGDSGGGSASGEPGLKGTNGGSSDKIVGTAPKTETIEKRKAVKIKMKDQTKIPKTLDTSNKKGMEKALKKYNKQIEKCYKRVIQKYGDQSGKIVANITIGTDGKVLKVSIPVDEIKKGLGDCVEAKIKRWKFPKLDKPVTVAKRWVFG